jgi:ParB-like chromosome segregation protein Spo0J
MKIPITKINIGDRQRIELGDLSDLDSMADKDIGQIVPIIIHKTSSGYELVEGRRRIAKAVQLGWTNIDAAEKDTLTPYQKQLMELIADIARKERTWQEYCLSVEKVHRVRRKEKRLAGEDWTLRAMARFTNMPKSNMQRLLTLAEHLREEPRDEELWSQDSYYKAWCLLVERQTKAASDELDRRKLLRSALVMPMITDTEPQSPERITLVDSFTEAAEIAPAPSSVPIRDDTKPIIINIYGRNMSFENAVEGKDYANRTFPVVIAFVTDWRICVKLEDASKGFFVAWTKKAIDSYDENTMPFPIVWNSYEGTDSDWPFVDSNYYGYVTGSKGNFSKDEQVSAQVNAFQHKLGVLPAAVVDWSLQTTSKDGDLVLCVGGIEPVDIAQSGRVPFWFEPDPAEFEKKQNALEALYRETIPLVQIQRR